MLQAALLDGFILSGLLSVLILGSLRFNAETWLNDYPPDIREKFGAMSAKARRQRIPFALLFLVILLGVIVRGLLNLYESSGGEISFLPAFTYVLVVGQVFNLVDLVVLDWLFFVTLRPKFIVLPGTEGMAGYKDYGFHFRAFLIGLVSGVVVSAVFAGGAVAIAWAMH